MIIIILNIKFKYIFFYTRSKDIYILFIYFLIYIFKYINGSSKIVKKKKKFNYSFYKSSKI